MYLLQRYVKCSLQSNNIDVKILTRYDKRNSSRNACKPMGILTTVEVQKCLFDNTFV